MRQAWERFYDSWTAAAHPTEPPRPGDPDRMRRLAAATSLAARVTERHLRDEADWSLVNARILIGRLVEAVDAWVEHGRDLAQLRGWLRAAWIAEQTLEAAERERRRATDAVLSGTAVGAGPAPAAPELEPVELWMW